MLQHCCNWLLLCPRWPRTRTLTSSARLQDTIDLATVPLAKLMNDTMVAEVDDVLLNIQAQKQSGTLSNSDHATAEAQLTAYRNSMSDNIANRAPACSALAPYNYAGYPSSGGTAGTIVPSDSVYNSGATSAALVNVTLDPPPGSSLTYNDLLPGSVTTCAADACICTKIVSLAEAAKTSRFDTMQTQLIARLDRTNGRLGAQKTRKLGLLRTIVVDTPALFEFIIDLSQGLEPLTNPENALIDDVIAVYVDGPSAYGVNGQPNAADSALKRTTILELNQTNPDARGILVERSQV
jgi:hypothetical protein